MKKATIRNAVSVSRSVSILTDDFSLFIRSLDKKERKGERKKRKNEREKDRKKERERERRKKDDDFKNRFPPSFS